jgi:hypothetical protein
MQGLITITGSIDNSVLMKIVSNCTSSSIVRTAAVIKNLWPLRPEQVYEIAINNKFGCPNCLVVVTDLCMVSSLKEEIPPRFRETFKTQEFNPLKEDGELESYYHIDV